MSDTTGRTTDEHPGALLSAMADGELSLDEAAAVEAHVDDCHDCRAELADVRAARSSLRALPPVDLPDRVVSRVRHSARPPQPRRAFSVAALATAAALVAAVLLVVRPPRQRVDTAALVADAASAQPVALRSGRERPMAAVPARYRAPTQLEGGYERVATFRDGRLVHQLYSHGADRMSVFAEMGVLSRSGLPLARSVRMGSWNVTVYARSGASGVTWQAGPVIYTVLSARPADEVLRAAGSMPAPARLSVLARLRRLARRAVETVSA